MDVGFVLFCCQNNNKRNPLQGIAKKTEHKILIQGAGINPSTLLSVGRVPGRVLCPTLGTTFKERCRQISESTGKQKE